MDTTQDEYPRSASEETYRPGGFVTFFSADRRVLWADAAWRDVSRPEDLASFRRRDVGDSFPLALARGNPALNAAFATRLPQSGRVRFREDGVERAWWVRAFPDFDPDREFTGVIQVAEPYGEDVGGTEIRRRDIENPFDFSLGGLILYDPLSDRVVGVNRRTVQHLGYSVEEFERMPGARLFRAEHIDILTRVFHRMIKAGEGMIWGQTLLLRDARGKESAHFCSLSPLREKREPGSPILMCISVDPNPVSGKNGESDQSPTRFVAEALEDGLWEFDFSARRFYYSPLFTPLFGSAGASPARGKPVDDWMGQVHPDDLGELLRNWRQLSKTGQHYRVQYRIRDCEGNWRWIMSTIHGIINDAGGSPRRILGMHMDFTDAMRTERNLVEAETQLRMIFENAGFGIAVLALDGRLQKVNPVMCRILGRETMELLGHRLPEFAIPEDAEAMALALDRVVRGGSAQWTSERRFLSGDGVLVWVRLKLTISENELDGSKCMVVIMEDITDRLARQEKLQYNATHDALTGAWSRGVLMERLGQHLNLALRYDQPLAFCICDLDHFKNVNDLHGHQTGDRVLKKFVETLRDAVRETDIVARYGGEEFGIVFPNTTVGGAAAAMERARARFKEQVFHSDSGARLGATATFGLAGVRPGATVNSIVAEADSALYRGKKGGRDRVVTHEP